MAANTQFPKYQQTDGVAMDKTLCQAITHLGDVIEQCADADMINDGGKLELLNHLQHIYNYKFYVKMTDPVRYEAEFVAPLTAKEKADKIKDKMTDKSRYRWCECCKCPAAKKHWARHKTSVKHLSHVAQQNVKNQNQDFMNNIGLQAVEVAMVVNQVEINDKLLQMKTERFCSLILQKVYIF